MPLPAGLLTLDASQINIGRYRIALLPCTLEKLQIGSVPVVFETDSTDGGLFAGKNLSNLVELSVLDASRLDSNFVVRGLPKTLTSLSLSSKRPTDPMISWMPPKLTSLHTSFCIYPSQYAQLPRTLAQVSSNRLRDSTPAYQRWEIAGGKDPAMYSRFRPPSERHTHPLAGDSESEGGLLSLPPALKHLQIGTHPPKHMPDFLTHLSSHFINGLTSLDMRSTRDLHSSQFVHLPVTLTQIKFQDISLPKVQNLRHLVRLIDLGLWSGMLTTAISKALPSWIKTLTLFHISLITKGFYHPSGDPKAAVLYSADAPHMKSLSHLPAGLDTLQIVPCQSCRYWTFKLPEILDHIPADRIESLVLDFATRSQISIPPSLAVSVSRCLTRFKGLRHLYWNPMINEQAKANTDDLANLSFPFEELPLLEAAFLPTILLQHWAGLPAQPQVPQHATSFVPSFYGPLQRLPRPISLLPNA